MPANTPEEPVEVRVRRRLRKLRTERGLALQQVAERAGIDVSTRPLTRRGPAGGLHAYKIRASPERRTPPSVLPVHEGHDWL